MVSIVYTNILATIMSIAIINIHIYVITNLLCYVYVKLNMKIYTFITFQKHDGKYFSISVFLGGEAWFRIALIRITITRLHWSG